MSGGPHDTPGPRPDAGGLLAAPLPLMRALAVDLETTGDALGRARGRARPPVDAGPAAGPVADFVAGADAATSALVTALRTTGAGLAETAADLARTDELQSTMFVEQLFVSLPRPEDWS